MTSSQIDTRLREAAEDTRRAASRLAPARPDVTVLSGQASRRNWIGVGAGVAVAFSATAVLAVAVLGGSSPPPSPEVVGNATVPATPNGEDGGPSAPSDGAGAGQEQSAVERWIRATPGDALELDRGGLASLAPATGDPVVVDWGPTLAEVGAGTDGATGTWSGEELRYLQASVASTGEVLVTLGRPEAGQLLLAESGSGDVQLLGAELKTVMSVVAAPAGGWLVSGVDTDGQAVLVSIAPAGDVADSAVLSPAPPRGGGLLKVVGSEVWLVNSFESVDLDRGPQATLVSSDGGATLISEVAWRPAGDVVPEIEPVNFSGSQGALASVVLDEGEVNIGWSGDEIEGEQTFVPVGLNDSGVTLGTPLTLSFGNSDQTSAETAAGRMGDVLIVATADEVLVGRLEPDQSTESAASMITPSPDGRLWHVTFTSTELRTQEVLLPTESLNQ